MYSELSRISRQKFGDNGLDILHDLIIEHGEDWGTIKAYLLTQKHLQINYETLGVARCKEHWRLNTPKTCCICKELKQPNEFYIISRKRGKDLQECCRECSVKRVKEYYEENKEKRLAYHKKHYAENREEIRSLHRLKMKITNGYQKRYEKIKADPEKMEKQREYHRKWREKNKEKTKLYKANYRAKLKAESV